MDYDDTVGKLSTVVLSWSGLGSVGGPTRGDRGERSRDLKRKTGAVRPGEHATRRVPAKSAASSRATYCSVLCSVNPDIKLRVQFCTDVWLSHVCDRV